MPKSISGSVGKGGKNRFEDVLTIQYLLNCVPSSRGGPDKELVLDGLCGNLTNAAISKFQLAALGFADGRVDPGGQTIQTLLAYDPYPSMKLTLPTVDSSGKGTGKRGGNPMNNCWDPFGYYNPSGPNYMKSGHEPPPFEGKQDQEIESWAGPKGGGYGGKSGAGQQGGGYGGGYGGQSGAGQQGGGYGGKSGAGQQGGGYGGQSGAGQQGGGYGGKSGPDQQGGGYGGKGGQGQPGLKGGNTGQGNPSQPIVMIGGGGVPGKTGQAPPSNTKGSQSQGGIVGKV
jgi:hypothetical protein